MTRVAVVANPTKSGDPSWAQRVVGVLERAGLPGATWLPTTADDPGPVMEKLLEEISFTASDKPGTKVEIDAAYVREKVSELAKNADLSKFVL